MRVFRKRRRFGNFGGAPEDRDSMPDIVYQMGAEAAARYVAQAAADEEAGYGLPPIYLDAPVMTSDELEEDVRSSSPLNFLRSALGLSRSRSGQRLSNGSPDRFRRAGSPDHFGHRSLGSPVHFHRRPHSPEHFAYHSLGSPERLRRRPHSPELVRSRPSSPYLFGRHERVPSPLHFPLQSRPSSPDVIRRMQRAQLSQDLQRMEKQQRHQQDAMMAYQQQLSYPLINSNADLQAWGMMQQQPMYSFY